MTYLLTLFWADRIAIRHWIGDRTASKAIVATLFLIVFSFVSFCIGAVSTAFFRYLAGIPSYGRMTADYLLHAALVSVMCLGIGSSITSTIGILRTANASLRYLLTEPVPYRFIGTYLYSKAAFVNAVFSAFVFLPVFWSYTVAFGVPPAGFIAGSFIILGTTSLLTTAVGALMAIPISAIVRRREHSAAILGLVLSFTGIVALFRTVFPAQLYHLTDAPIEQLPTLFAQLPLNNRMLLTGILAETMTVGLTIRSVLAVAVSGMIIWSAIAILTRSLVPSVIAEESSGSGSHRHSRWWHILFLKTRFPFALKDLLSIVRKPSESGYGLFLLSVAAFFFVFLRIGLTHARRLSDWQTEVIVFVLGWIVFFATAWCLRFSFPLMAREGKSAWFIFSQPVATHRILYGKLQVAFVTALIPAFGAAAVWYLLPLPQATAVFLTALSFPAIVCLSVIQTLIGMIRPNFRQGDNPESVSTSGMGLATLTVSLAVMTGLGYITTSVQHNWLDGVNAVIIACSGMLLIAAVLIRLASTHIRSYTW